MGISTQTAERSDALDSDKLIIIFTHIHDLTLRNCINRHRNSPVVGR